MTALGAQRAPRRGDAAHVAGFVPVAAELESRPRGPTWTVAPADGEPVIVNPSSGAIAGHADLAEA